MFKESYHRMNSHIFPSEQLMQDVLSAARGKHCKKRMISLRLKRNIMMLVVFSAILVMTMPVIASTVEPIYQLMYMVSPSVAQFFMPVQKSSISNGIKLEVVSANIHQKTAEIYVTMQDLTENRIDGTTDLFDSYTINRPFDSSAHCQMIGYDEKTKIVTFLITIDEWGGQNIDGDKITFSVREFLSQKNSYEDLAIPVSLANIADAEHTQTVSSNGGGGRDYQGYLEFEKNPIALVPSVPMANFPIDGIAFTGIAYIDGELHIQTAVEHPLDNDNHGFFYLKDENGTEIDCDFSFYFSETDEQIGRIDYHECVFDVPLENIAAYALYGDFVTSGMKTEGDWRVTFPLESVE
ncbi:hypothetical protein KHM83_14165 [Fusibacter paucivorans]|uniref:DUF4179 domain-containing protein n=1 Tax=Fusibacter paucivorans TaxID=76009 RepID=A0ABS5PTY8_9FIRM|nr:hypothetical protein [Fusibacter paucivorans]MBS7527826.1 hypothetical protein [Fusibacter paucivorans]